MTEMCIRDSLCRGALHHPRAAEKHLSRGRKRRNRHLPHPDMEKETGCELDVYKRQAYPHNYGCSQLGDDHENTNKILRDMVLHPNAGAVLVVGLGCENNPVSYTHLDVYKRQEQGHVIVQVLGTPVGLHNLDFRIGEERCV